MTDLFSIDPQAAHLFSWRVGWSLILLGFASGAVVGLFFHRAAFQGGYASWRRRLMRLGHVAFVALGMVNLLFALGLAAGFQPSRPELAAYTLATGGLLMPVNCLLASWHPAFRHLFAVPVLLLGTGAVCALLGGLS